MRDLILQLSKSSIYSTKPSGRKNSQFRRNYLVKCSCPNCAKESEHSFTRIQKGAQLVCPYCSALFKSSQRL
ncbi:YnfU family zinc-binding protein [Enterobacter hormaechei]|uniref:YnfU family zinc-binding protein n=1 Tax=Enterobacter cloacae complex TaxID=354276 RepID=UPI0009B1F083|nr:YnfU family zinc-binding protein [Enterobacter cloacae complex sp. 2023EL-00493]MDN4652237.1 YnfU family zinc-binding protein [Enterobacter cloacae complex sp. 2023EL-00493]MDP5175440.1 YnfU family zinc-binding protein [Enterobacter hormaechei]